MLLNTPEAQHERLPRWVEDAGLAITAEARIDNRAELCDLFRFLSVSAPPSPTAN
ncbi:MAG: hypothetical protein R2873_05515 [Caldilineaceae bacterium]